MDSCDRGASTIGESFIDLETAFLVRRHVVESSSVVLACNIESGSDAPRQLALLSKYTRLLVLFWLPARRIGPRKGGCVTRGWNNGNADVVRCGKPISYAMENGHRGQPETWNTRNAPLEVNLSNPCCALLIMTQWATIRYGCSFFAARPLHPGKRRFTEFHIGLKSVRANAQLFTRQLPVLLTVSVKRYRLYVKFLRYKTFVGFVNKRTWYTIRVHRSKTTFFVFHRPSICSGACVLGRGDTTMPRVVAVPRLNTVDAHSVINKLWTKQFLRYVQPTTGDKFESFGTPASLTSINKRPSSPRVISRADEYQYGVSKLFDQSERTGITSIIERTTFAINFVFHGLNYL